MTGYPEPKLCWVGRTLQKLGCLPKKTITNTQVYYPITMLPVDGGSDYGYNDDVKFNPGPHFPPPQPGYPNSYVAMYQQVPETPEFPIAQTIPLNAQPLPVDAFPGYTPATTCTTLNVDQYPAHSTVQISPAPYLASLPVIPHTPDQSAVPCSILQNLGGIAPTQYTWNTPHGALTYTPAPTSTLPLPHSLPNPGSCSASIVDVRGGDGKPTGPSLIPSLISSDTSDPSDSSSDDRRSGVALNPVLATVIEWNVSEPVDTAKCVLDDTDFTASASEPATDPPTNKLCIELDFVDHPGVKWNWEPITIRKSRTIRIADVFHAIHNYFQTQITHAEYDIIKSHGKANGRIVRDSWRERLRSHPVGETQCEVYCGGLRRVDCLGSSKNFAGLWVDGSQLRLRLCA